MKCFAAVRDSGCASLLSLLLLLEEMSAVVTHLRLVDRPWLSIPALLTI